MNFFQWNYVSMNENVKLKIRSKSEFWMQSLNRKFCIKHFEFWETHCTSGFNSTRIIYCHSLSLDVPFVVTRCYSSRSVSLAVIRYHSLPLFVVLVATWCRSLSLFVSLVVTYIRKIKLRKSVFAVISKFPIFNVVFSVDPFDHKVYHRIVFTF